MLRQSTITIVHEFISLCHLEIGTDLNTIGFGLVLKIIFFFTKAHMSQSVSPFLPLSFSAILNFAFLCNTAYGLSRSTTLPVSKWCPIMSIGVPYKIDGKKQKKLKFMSPNMISRESTVSVDFQVSARCCFSCQLKIQFTFTNLSLKS